MAFRPEADRYRLTPQHTAYLRVAEGCNHSCTFCAIPGFRWASLTCVISLTIGILARLVRQAQEDSQWKSNKFHIIQVPGLPLLGRKGKGCDKNRSADGILTLGMFPGCFSAPTTSSSLVIVRQAEDIVASHNDHGRFVLAWSGGW